MPAEYKYGRTTMIVHRPDKRMSDDELKEFLRKACIEAIKNDQAKRTHSLKAQGK